MLQTKTIAMILLIAIAIVGAIGIGIGTGINIQLVYGAPITSCTYNPLTHFCTGFGTGGGGYNLGNGAIVCSGGTRTLNGGVAGEVIQPNSCVPTGGSGGGEEVFRSWQVNGVLRLVGLGRFQYP